MPFIRVTAPSSLFDEKQRREIAEKLTVAIMKVETGGLDTPGFRAISALVFENIAPNEWSIGGTLGDEPAALVEIRVPEGALDESRRKQMAALSYQILREISTRLASVDGVRRVWTHMIEIADGNWGAGGRVMTLPDVRQVAQGATLAPAVE